MRLLLLSLVFLCCIACKAVENPFEDVDILAEFVGHWDRLNVFGGEIEKVIILKKSPGIISVELLGNDPEREWGIRFFRQYELAAGPLEMEFYIGETEIQQQLSLLASGKMEIVSVEKDKNKLLDTVKTYLFTQNRRIKLFDRIERHEVIREKLSREKLFATPGKENVLLPNSILFYQTTEGRYGKLQIRGNADILTLRWKTWKEDGSLFSEADYMETKANAYYEMNRGKKSVLDADCLSDFLLEEDESASRFLTPQCGASFALYHLGN